MQTVGADAPKGNDQSMTGPPSATRLTVQEAAEALGITVEAVRARIKRGKLRREKGEDGTVYVWLDAAQARPDSSRHHPSGKSAPGPRRACRFITGASSVHARSAGRGEGSPAEGGHNNC